MDPDNINSIKTIITDTIHIFMGSHGHTVRQTTNIQHHMKILLLLDLSVAFLFLSPLIDASEKKDIIKRKGRGCGRERLGGEWAASCCLAMSLQGDMCVRVDVGVCERICIG